LSLTQESVKTKHPQLLYESKLYKILQGGSAYSPPHRTDFMLLCAMPVANCKVIGACSNRFCAADGC